MTSSNTSKRGFAAMDDNKRHKVANRGKVSSVKQDMAELGKKGAATQSTDAKRRGGQNSHRNG